MSKTLIIRETVFDDGGMNSGSQIYGFSQNAYDLYHEYYQGTALHGEHNIMFEHCGGGKKSWDDIKFLIKEHGWDYMILDSYFNLSIIEYCVLIVEETDE